jgi:crotonobetainyl-CoA:carnitine CoA-transferase CaiB-like acyl-CoA transferase
MIKPEPRPAFVTSLGEHTREVLGSLLGLDDASIDSLADEGIV